MMHIFYLYISLFLKKKTGLLHALRSLNGTSTSIRDYVRQERRNGLDGLLDIMSNRPSSITLPVPVRDYT